MTSYDRHSQHVAVSSSRVNKQNRSNRVVVEVVVASDVEVLDAGGGQSGPETNPGSGFASAYPVLQMHPSRHVGSE